MQDIS